MFIRTLVFFLFFLSSSPQKYSIFSVLMADDSPRSTSSFYPHDDSTPQMEPTAIDHACNGTINLPRGKICRVDTSPAEWTIVARRIDVILRPYALRYGKLSGPQIHQIVLEAIGQDVDEEDAYYRKGWDKVRGNLGTWKNRTLGCMKVGFPVETVECNRWELMSDRTTS